MLNVPSTKAEWVFDQVRESILKGELKPNDRLRLKDLAQQYGTSQMPVREALRMLHRDGLVNIQNHRGAVVTDLSVEQGCELIVVRTHLEALAVEEALPFHTDNTVVEMERLISRMESCLTKGNPDEFSKLNREFHTVLMKPCKLKVLLEEIDDLWDRMWKVRGQSLFSSRPQRIRGAHEEHKRILAAVKTKKLDRVTKAVKAHRDQSVKAWKSLVEEAKKSSPA